jgi:mannose-1-phosphate guanylyltransferase/mannose-6-phosphate isomerase
VINVTPANLCRVSGTRLWPLSRAGFSKKFVGLPGNDSIFQHEASDLKTGKQHALLKANGNNVNVSVE